MSNGSASSRSEAGLPEQAIDVSTVRQELDAVLASAEFAGATRLQSFLRYVVEEGLAGKGAAIRAKTIGEDVYGVLSNQGDDPLAVVRVDAGRLRRRLDAYYSNSENRGAVRIHIDKGGYAPRFEALSNQVEKDLAKRADPGFPFVRKKLWIGLSAALFTVLVVALTQFSLFEQQGSATIGASDAPSPAVREALFAASPAKLQAKNLADDARDLMFPALDRQRLLAALALFEQVIALDDEYYAGFAGAGQINALLASQMPASSVRDEFLSAASERAERALELAPDASWAQSSMAMVSFADKECEQAATYSERATRLSPGDLYALNFDALIALFCGEFDHAVSVAKPLIGSSELSDRLVFRNVAATAEFHRGNFQETIDLYTSAINSGAPVGALTLAYLAAANAKLGQTEEAKRNVDLLAEAWPDLPLESLLFSVFVESNYADDVMNALREVGWRPKAG